MGTVTVNGISLTYSVQGSGEPVLLLPPAASASTVWTAHQVPALVRAGFRVITVDNRGTPPSDVPDGPYRLADLVADTAGLVRRLGIAPCRIVGASLGAMIAQELAIVRPDLVHSMALMATRGRTDFFRRAVTESAAEAVRRHREIPARYAALNTMIRLFSPDTLLHDRDAADWLELFIAFAQQGEGAAAQYEATLMPDRLAALGAIDRPTLVIAFADDVLTPPALGREVADAIPGSRYVELAGCGHFGFLERPDEVNRVLVDFLGSPAVTGDPVRAARA